MITIKVSLNVAGCWNVSTEVGEFNSEKASSLSSFSPFCCVFCVNLMWKGLSEDVLPWKQVGQENSGDREGMLFRRQQKFLRDENHNMMLEK